jgi:hypothetical protein
VTRQLLGLQRLRRPDRRATWLVLLLAWTMVIMPIAGGRMAGAMAGEQALTGMTRDRAPCPHHVGSAADGIAVAELGADHQDDHPGRPIPAAPAACDRDCCLLCHGVAGVVVQAPMLVARRVVTVGVETTSAAKGLTPGPLPRPPQL